MRGDLVLGLKQVEAFQGVGWGWQMGQGHGMERPSSRNSMCKGPEAAQGRAGLGSVFLP